MSDVAYKRVSSVDQKTDRQLEGLKFDKAFEDKASGKDTNRPQLEACLDYIREGDHLHVHSIDRLCRNLGDLERIVKELNEKGIVVHFHKENLVFSGKSDPMNVLMMQLLGAVSQFERALIRERQREGIAAAKAKGKRLGRSASLTPEQIEDIRTKIDVGQTVADLSKVYGVSRQTIYTSLERQKPEEGKIKCRICDESIDFIQSHLTNAHSSMSVGDYQKSYPDALLASTLGRKLLYRKLTDRGKSINMYDLDACL